MTPQLTNDLKTVLNWFEEEPELWLVLTLIISCLCVVEPHDNRWLNAYVGLS